ncbi:MAG: hypothetical protein QXK80_03535 [Candidatus Pacearchaeota archaeon]
MKIIEKRGKKAQIMGLPFQFIFAIILVAVAVFVGFYVIRMFLNQAEQAKINDFVKNQLEYEIKNIWMTEEAKVTKDLPFSKNFDYVCFINQSKPCSQNTNVPLNFCSEYEMWKNSNKDNLFLIPLGKAEKYNTLTAWHISCGTKECISFNTNPYCLPVNEGKVSIKLLKESGNPLVIISRP